MTGQSSTSGARGSRSPGMIASIRQETGTAWCSKRA
jgi:hypothetical protein